MHICIPHIKLPPPPDAIQPENQRLTWGKTVTQARYTVRYAIQVPPPSPYRSYRTVTHCCDTGFQAADLLKHNSLEVLYRSIAVERWDLMVTFSHTSRKPRTGAPPFSSMPKEPQRGEQPSASPATLTEGDQLTRTPGGA